MRRPTLAVAVLAVVVASCRGIVGIEDAPPTHLVAEAGTCGVSSPDPSCASCITSSCCAEADRCAGDEGCKHFAACIAKCAPGDTACGSECRRQWPNGFGAEAAALASCQAAKCESACGTTCGGYVYANGNCGACGVAHCCEAATECMRDPDCAALAACERACSKRDGACLQRCELARPSESVEKERALGDCLSNQCAATCIRPQWDCLVHPPPAPAATGPIHVTYRAVDYGDKLGRVPNLAIRACRAGTDCSIPLAGPEITDPFGEATLAINEPLFNGYAEIRSADYATVLVYLPPLTHDFVAFVPVVQAPVLAAFGDQLKPPVPLQANSGHLLVGVLDCDGGDGPGVKLEIDPATGATPFYFNGGAPSRSATATDDDPYTGAYGGFLNVAANTEITVRATVAENALAYPSPRVVDTRPGLDVYTVVLLAPAP